MRSFGKIAILGDSYSTFEGYVSSGNAVWYDGQKNNIDTVEKTWWKLLENETQSKIIVNDSFSGSTISRICWGTINIEQSFPERAKRIDFKNINTLFIFGGTNDSWTDIPLGEIKYENFIEEDYLLTLPSFCSTIDRIKLFAPNVKIINIVNTDLKNELVEGYRVACKHYDIDNIELKNIKKTDGHPDDVGMKQIKDQIINFYK